MDLWEKGILWGQWRERKLWSGWIVSEKNLFKQKRDDLEGSIDGSIDRI